MSLRENILVLTQWSYKDALVQTYTLPYVSMIREILPADKRIFVLTSEQQQIALKPDELSTINHDWNKHNMQLLAQSYKHFGWKKMVASMTQLFKLYRFIKKHKIGVIHAFCTPAGGVGYLLSKLTGRPLIIDSYEPHAEAMVENGAWRKDGPAYRILWKLEKKQTARAVSLIATTEGMRQYAMDNFNVEPKSFFVKPACVDLQQFHPQEKNVALLKELGLQGKMVCVYAGKLGGIYLKDEVFDLIRQCHQHWGDRFRFLMLTNAKREEIDEACRSAQVPKEIVISKFVFHHEVPAYLSLGDFAINPVKPVPTKRYCTSIKDGEYWASGLPVFISPNISDDSAIIEKENIGVVVDFYNNKQMPEAINKMEKLLAEGRDSLARRVRIVAEKYRSFDIARKIYSSIYK